MEATTIKMYSDTIKYDDGDMIWVKPVCDLFNLHVQNQYIKIKNDPILGVLYGKNSTDLGKIDTTGRIFLSKKGFLRWIQIINANTIDENLRENFTMYQSQISDFLYGSAELHTAIRNTRAELEEWSAMYSTAGNMIQSKKKELEELLNNMFQYRLPFNETKQLN